MTDRPAVDAPRVVSLLPSATETVCALDAGDLLVGVSHECDFPPWLRGRPVLTGSRLDDGASSSEIDRAVRDVLDGALSLYTVDQARLGALRPDVVITQDLCEVCAVSLDDVRSAVARLAQRDSVDVVSLSPTRLQHVLDDVERVGEALGLEERARRVRAALRGRIDHIAERAAAARTRPRVVTVEWLDPIMLGGTWMPELIEYAGGEAVGAEAGAPAPTVSSEALVELEPDVVVLKPCGFGVDRTLRERPLVERTIAAPLGRDVPLWVTDGNAFFNRPGPRLVESLEILAAILHPGLFEDFAAKHRGLMRRL